MYQLIQYLEPFREKGKTVLKEELDEFNEIMFVNKGKVMIGYEINKEKRYCIAYHDKIVIGAYGITFNQRAAFIYAALTPIEGYFIRKTNWI
jgi:hypothetical protein